MARTLTLIRHTTPDVAPGVCYGQLDTGLAATFQDEAARTRDWLTRPDLILASPLKRAARLAEYLAQAQQTALGFDARLMEKHFGTWEGQAWDSIARAQLDAWAADLMGYTPPGGESAQALMRRTGALLGDLARLPQAHIALVAHAGPLRALLAHLGGIPLAATLGWELSFGTVIAVRV